MLLSIGGFIAGNPNAYLAQFNSQLSSPISFLSELRAFGSGLMGVGFLAGLSLIVPKLKQVALAASTTLFASYFLGRVASMLADGIPNQGIIIAAGIEHVFTLIGLYLLNKEVKSWI